MARSTRLDASRVSQIRSFFDRVDDTVSLPIQVGNTPGQVKFRTRFPTFTGQFVIHCHYLDHKDLGMMSLVQVV